MLKMFSKDNEYYLGVNYWASKDSINMWENWDAETVEKDFEKLSKHGINVIRMFR